MTWVDDMKRDAVALAFPEWEWQEGDVADMCVDYDPDYSTLTPGDGFNIHVSVERDGKSHHFHTGEDSFFYSLMTKGSRG